MLDIRRIRSDFDAVRTSLERRHDPALGEELEIVRDLDERQRLVVAERDDLRARVNALSKDVGTLHRDGRASEAEALRDQSRELGERAGVLGEDADRLGIEVRELLLRLPNTPASDCPDGADDGDNVVLRVHGYDEGSYADHQRVPHWDIGSMLGILDLERAVKMSGSMFTMFRGQGATLARALCQAALDRNADAFEEVRPPTVVSTETMVSTGHLPKFSEEAYSLERDGLWAIPTAEVPLTSLARDEILDESDLPMRLMAYTPCFRREAGAAGRDTRGLLRVHEFDKVEILAYATPGQAAAVHEEILARAEGLIRDLGLAYRIVDICAGDIGNSAARTFDIEVYAPGVDQWLECSSVSWFSDYQARRANIRYRPALTADGPSGGNGATDTAKKSSKRTEIVHTLNGSALAVPRVWAALVETHRRADGSVALPEVLHPYMRGATSLSPC